MIEDVRGPDVTTIRDLQEWLCLELVSSESGQPFEGVLVEDPGGIETSEREDAMTSVLGVPVKIRRSGQERKDDRTIDLGYIRRSYVEELERMQEDLGPICYRMQSFPEPHLYYRWVDVAAVLADFDRCRSVTGGRRPRRSNAAARVVSGSISSGTLGSGS